MTNFKPMLAGKVDFTLIQYPVMGSPKLDGIRATVIEGRLLSRTLKEIPNRYVFELLSKPEFEGLDGELIVGDPTDKACFRKTTSGVMSRDGHPDFTFYVFDRVNPNIRWSQRTVGLVPLNSSPFLQKVQHEILFNYGDVCEYEAAMIAYGYEGIILRDPDGLYKFGRSTTDEGLLLKVKRYEDSEGVIIGMEEEMENQNELSRDERGYAKRTSHQANKVGKGTMGALLIRDIHTGIESRVGSGFDYRTRKEFWDNKGDYMGKVIKYKFFPVGVKDKPRHPVFIGFRPEGA